MRYPEICPNCGGEMEYFGPDDPREDDGEVETYVCEDCGYQETVDFGDYFEDVYVDREDYGDEATP